MSDLYWRVQEVLAVRGKVAGEDDFRLRDDSDGAGPYIEYWNTGKLGAEPLQTELDAAMAGALVRKQKALNPTTDDILDEMLASSDKLFRIVKALALAIAAGDLIAGGNQTNAEIKAAIKLHM